MWLTLCVDVGIITLTTTAFLRKMEAQQFVSTWKGSAA